MKTRSKTLINAIQAELFLKRGLDIRLSNGRKVEWINLNNQTCFASSGETSMMYDNEKVMFVLHEKVGDMKKRIESFNTCKHEHLYMGKDCPRCIECQKSFLTKEHL